MRKYWDKYKRRIIVYFANLDIIPEAKTVQRKVRQYYINRDKQFINLNLNK